MTRKNSRTLNVIINSFSGVFSKLIIFIIQFICRIFFIKYLSIEYLGINGLFYNILTMLSFAELGIGSAILFKLYKPIKNENKEKIKSLLYFYKKAYFIIGIIILFLGLTLIPLLKLLIGDITITENVYLIYVLFLINSSISYFFSYKRSIITVYQKEYILNFIDTSVLLVENIFQILYLYLSQDFIGYIILQIIGTLLQNIIVSIVADHIYPFIKEVNITKLTKNEEKEIFKDVKALTIYNLGYVISNGTDNMIISSFSGVTSVGLLSNYTTITNSISQFLISFFKGFTASVGNLNVNTTKKKKENIYYQILLLCFFIYSSATIEIIVLSNIFIKLWLGSEFVMDFSISVILGLNIYIDGMRFSNNTFRSTTGMFEKGKFRPLISSIINIILSIVLVKNFGVFGVLFSTAFARLFISTMWDPYLLHKYIFKSKSIKFYIRYLFYFIVLILNTFINMFFISKIKFNGFSGLLINFILIFIISTLINVLFTFHQQEFKGLIKKLKYIVKK